MTTFTAGRRERAVLALEDGSVFWGWSVGAPGKAGGEAVFHTGMTGYQELLSDPSSKGQIVAFTYPLVGNYGVNGLDEVSPQLHAAGFVAGELWDEPSNWRATGRLSKLLRDRGVVGVAGVDTRAVARALRARGAMRGIVQTGDVDAESLVEEARRLQLASGEDLVKSVAAKGDYRYADGAGPNVAVVDFGVKANLLQTLAARGSRVNVYGPTCSAQDILKSEPAGIVVSGGPGDPGQFPTGVQLVRELLGQASMFGLGLGHQLVGAAFGARTSALKQAHRGLNHPVREIATGRVYITSQNHGYAVEAGSWSDPDLVAAFSHVNDGSVEGLRHRALRVWSLQYDPFGAPGPDETAFWFDEFYDSLTNPV